VLQNHTNKSELKAHEHRIPILQSLKKGKALEVGQGDPAKGKMSS
jgi:hypothetical protein